MASYNPPNPYVPGAFNPTQFITPSDNITTKYLDENYLRFPFAQGVENFVSINNQGSLNQGGLADFSSNTTPAIFNLPPTITNPIANTATTPANAVATIGYVLANEQGGGDLLPLNNLWTGVNNFNPTPNQTYGAVLNTGITITDNQFPPGAQGDNDIISYTPTGAQGLCLYSSSTNSITGQFPQIQLYPDGTETKLSASATNGTIVLAAQGTGGAIQLNANTGVKIGTQPILTFSTFGNLTGSASGITSSVSIILPPQTTYTPSTTYGNTSATQQFVQLALASQGSGDVTLGGDNPFTGTNTFSGFCGTTTSQSYPQDDNQFVTASYVANFSTTPYPTNNFLQDQTYTAGVGSFVQIDNYPTGIQGNYIGNSLISMFPTSFDVTMIVGNTAGTLTDTLYLTTTTPIGNVPYFSVNISGTATYNLTLQQVSFTGTLDSNTPNLISLTTSIPFFQTYIPSNPNSGYNIYISTFIFNQTPP